jgi:anti-anti-sigma factor
MQQLQISSSREGTTATITLVGEVDAATASAFKAEIEKVAAGTPPLTKLVLMTRELTFMASAGLRVLIFAKQKLGTSVGVYVVEPQEALLDTLKKTGFDRGVFIVDSVPA